MGDIVAELPGCTWCREELKALREELSELKQWRSEHDGRINVFWRNQHEWDDDIEKRVEALERTIARALGGGAVLLLLGNLLIQYLFKIKG